MLCCRRQSIVRLHTARLRKLESSVIRVLFLFMSVNYDALVAGNCFGDINLTSSIGPMTSSVTENKPLVSLSDDFGLPLSELFNLARRFLKEKQEAQSIHITYNDNLRFVALSKQAKLGKWNASYTQDVGFLDVIGNNRKQAWIALGDMSKESAMEEYVKLLVDRCPSFRPYLQVQRLEVGEKDRLRQEDETRRTLKDEEVQRARQHQIEHFSRLEEQQKKREDLQRKQIQEALNQQTYSQFKAYAEQQYKDNQPAQDELIRQLQEQHFQQYLRQVYQQQILFQKDQLRTKSTMEQQQTDGTELPPAPMNIIIPPATVLASSSIPQLPPLGPAPAQLPPVLHPPPVAATDAESAVPIQASFETLSLQSPLEPSGEPAPGTDLAQAMDENALVASANGDLPLEAEGDKSEVPNLAQANMWTRKDVKEFKEQIRKEKDAVIKVGSGETVTVRVPTHEDGRCIFWEFTTDYYDIGFGVYFEWSKAQSNTVTVHVSDSSEEEEEGEEGNNGEKKDIEKGRGSTNKPPKPRQDEIVPICRRDCHEEVYAGSHVYPGEGVYLLKFDNSYSLWRSKTLYYRVYYSK